MNQQRLEIPPHLRRSLDYKKFRYTTRLLILTTGYFFDQSWKRAAESLGWRVATVSSAMTGALTRSQIQELFVTLAEFRPDFILTSNFAGMDTLGLFGKFFEDVRIPYVSYFTDTPRMILYEREVHCSHYTVAAIWERAYETHLRSLGFQHIFYMPHATDPDIFSGSFDPNPRRQVAFVGTSMIGLAEEAWNVLRESPGLYNALKEAFERGVVNRQIFAQGINAVIDPALMEKESSRQRRHAELCIIYEGTRRLREEVIRALAPLDLELRGDVLWRKIYPHADGNIGYFDDLAEYYRTTAVNVNVTSIQMVSSVNQRVFDCPAAGGFLITDDQADLYELFDVKNEVVIYKTIDELVDKTKFYIKRPDLRARIVANAQERIAREHTYACRLVALQLFLKNLYA